MQSERGSSCLRDHTLSRAKYFGIFKILKYQLEKSGKYQQIKI